MKYPICFIFAVSFFWIHLNAQTSEITLPWKAPIPVTIGESSYMAPTLDDGLPSDGIPRFLFRQELKSINLNASISSRNAIGATSEEIAYLRAVGFNPTDTLSYSLKVTRAGEIPMLSFSCFPFFLEQGILKKIVSISVNIHYQTPPSNQKDFVANSVLSQGEWYKIAITSDGIHKIDKSLLVSLGINTSGLNPTHIHVFGNGEGSLPELNSAPYTDDLAQNSIALFGAQDGTFDDGDYILFYGYGPHQWYANGSVEFEQRRNPYSDKSYYFIHINSSIPAKIINEVDYSTGVESMTYTSYDYRDVYENDLVSLVGGGKRWYGELFDTELTRSFTFSVPAIETTSPARFRVSLASNALSSAGTAQKYSVNGTQIFQTTLPVAPYDYNRSVVNFTANSPSSVLNVSLTVNRNNATTLTYLDRILLNARRNLTLSGPQFGFRNLTSPDSSVLVKYQLSNFNTSGFVWDLSVPFSPRRVKGVLTGGVFNFWCEKYYREFVASNGTSFLTPAAIGRINNQNLHGLSQVDYLIVTPAAFLNQAERLANLHRSEGLDVHVVLVDHIYNEFSSGAQDPTAIRKMAKMFHDRSIENGSKMIKYMCLFGDGTYDPKDRIDNNNNFIVTYQVDNSENHISALVTDDYFGMLDDNEAIYDSDLIDIGVGRLLISDATQAKQQVDKIEHYMKNGSQLFQSDNANCCLDDNSSLTFGDWRTKVVQIADDEENGYFIKNDTEPQYEILKSNHRELNVDKLYMDAYTQQTSAGGQRYPDVFDAITDRINRGTLVMNYVGHGGEVGLAEERVVTIPQIQSWKNINALTLFVSATCEFTKYDDPSRVSAGEWMLLNPSGGAIALMTTTRSVFFGVNSSVGLAFYNNAFVRDVNGNPRTFGEIVEQTKNVALSSDNKRSFTLIGDPALRLALPRLGVVTDSINGMDYLSLDTLRALSKVTVKGHIVDANNVLVNTFNGTIIPSVFDKIKINQTLAQDPGSPNLDFELQRNVLYKGKASVNNGYFEFTFIVPKDIALTYGRGKLSYYAFSTQTDAIGLDTTIVIGGIDPNGLVDSIGPEVNAYLNDEHFIDGGVADETPILYLKLYDDSGINTVGNGIGHDLIAILDEESSNPIVLNDYYTSDLNTYQSGQVKYPFSTLEAGQHTISVKAWDVNNNSSDVKISFTVKASETPLVKRLYNYPNPFSTSTEFMLEHNQSCEVMDVQIQIYTIGGRLVKTIQNQVNTQGFTTRGLYWDGRDEYGDRLANGVYIYRLQYQNSEGKRAEETQKLVIIN
ncbi:MAG: type IX secretion system sortase PorU [Flavobacteriales bacterium]